ncbi:MAG TPA: SGNH/GDSL hydrolase family protein [Pyrinomonadaceae bacterium]|nr:SGNH/GDSL hydrolase family protein [Pyrinomonadaceae bacterium]
MKKLAAVLLFTIFLFAAFAQAQIYDREKIWEKEINAFAEIDRRQTPPENAVLFVGSSSIRMWENLRSSFPQLKVINRGFGGSRLEDVNHYFDRIVAPYKPKTIVLYAGENDVNEGASPEKVAEEYQRFARMVREKLPKTKIFYISIKPSPSRWKIAEQFRKANELIKAQIEKDKSARFVDVFSPMLSANGEPMPDIFLEDNLHMNAKGYEIWRGVLEKYLK